MLVKDQKACRNIWSAIRQQKIILFLHIFAYLHNSSQQAIDGSEFQLIWDHLKTRKVIDISFKSLRGVRRWKVIEREVPWLGLSVHGNNWVVYIGIVRFIIGKDHRDQKGGLRGMGKKGEKKKIREWLLVIRVKIIRGQRSSYHLVLVKPMMSAHSLKHFLQSMMSYLRIRPIWQVQHLHWRLSFPYFLGWVLQSKFGICVVDQIIYILFILNILISITSTAIYFSLNL